MFLPVGAGMSRLDAQFTIGEIDAWKLFTKSMPRDFARSKVEVEGDVELALKALETVSIIA